MIWIALRLLRAARRWRVALVDEATYDRDLSLQIDRLSVAIEALEGR